MRACSTPKEQESIRPRSDRQPRPRFHWPSRLGPSARIRYNDVNDIRMAVPENGSSSKDDLTRLFARDSAALQNPYPLYNRLREQAALLAYDANTVIVWRHAEAKRIYQESARFPNPKDLDNKFVGRYGLLSPAELDLHEQWMASERTRMSRLGGDEHRRVRGVVHGEFTPKKLDTLRDSITRLTVSLLDELEAETEPDFMHFAYRLPLLVILDMLGLPREDGTMLKHWCDAIGAPGGGNPLRPEVVRSGHAAAAEFRLYIRELIKAQRRRPEATSLVAALLHASDVGHLSQDELISMYVLLLFAGHETMTSMLGNGLLALLRHPRQWQMLCAEPALIPRAIEEIVRYDPPFQFLTKTTADRQELAQIDIPAGMMVLVSNAAANRDPRVFDNPDEFDIARRRNDHLGFGHGLHFCLGASLARLEGHIVLGALARRYPDMQLASGAHDVAYMDNFLLRRPTSLRIELSGRRDHARFKPFSGVTA